MGRLNKVKVNIIQRVFLTRLQSDIIKKTRHPRQCCPPYTLKYIQALLLRDDFEVKLLDCRIKQPAFSELIEASLSWEPELLVIEADFLCYDDAIKYADTIKKEKNILIILISQVSEYINDNRNCVFDLVFCGEAEEQVVAVIKKNNQGENVYKEKSTFSGRKEVLLVDRLNVLPFPRYELTEFEEYRLSYPIQISEKVIWGHMLSTRGCAHKCIFCAPFNRYSFGKRVRFRSSVNIVDEMEGLIKHGVNVISFDDDDFTFYPKHVISVCNEIQKRNLRISWIAHARVDEVDFDLLKIMRKAGCILLRLGIESGSKRILDILEKNPLRIDWIEKSKAVFKATRELDIATVALFIIGNPTETKKDLRASIQLAKDLDPDLIQIHFFTPYIGSIAYDRFKLQIGSLDDSNKLKMYHYSNPQVKLSGFSLDDLSKIRTFFYRAVLLKPKFIFRHLKHYLMFYLHNFNVLKNVIRIWDIL